MLNRKVWTIAIAVLAFSAVAFRMPTNLERWLQVDDDPHGYSAYCAEPEKAEAEDSSKSLPATLQPSVVGHEIERDAIDQFFTFAEQVRTLPYARVYLQVADRQRPNEWRVTVIIDKDADLELARWRIAGICESTRRITGRTAGFSVATMAECDCTGRRAAEAAKQEPTPAKRPGPT